MLVSVTDNEKLLCYKKYQDEACREARMEGPPGCSGIHSVASGPGKRLNMGGYQSAELELELQTGAPDSCPVCSRSANVKIICLH